MHLFVFYDYVYLALRRQFATVPTPPGAKLPGLYTTRELSVKRLFIINGLTTGTVFEYFIEGGLLNSM
jgi:hypothetical protein